MNEPQDRTFARYWLALLGLGALLCCALPAGAVTQLKRQSNAPPFALKDLDGNDVSNESLRGRLVVLVFGEIYHEKTREACGQIDAVLHDQRLEGQKIVPVLIAAQDIRPEDLAPYANQHLPRTIVRDPARKAFGAYQVAVMPSVVIIDKDGKVVFAIGGLTERLGDNVTDSLLFAAGKLSAENFERALNPQPTTASVEGIRAGRLAKEAGQLARRGLEDLAVDKYEEAIKADPNQWDAHQELGMLLLKRRRLPEAETHFHAVLKAQPGSTAAQLGLAFVQTLRGGAELEPAERSVRDLLARNPTLARAHYLLGLILEQRGKPEDAAASFKKAAQLLLERVGDEQEQTHEQP